MAEAKHAFVDDNPYLVYSPNAETTYDGNSGGGGGVGFPIIEFDNETGALSVTAGELTEMLGIAPVMSKYDEDGDLRWYLIIASYYDTESYSFKAISISGTELQILEWQAESANDYPTPYIGG